MEKNFLKTVFLNKVFPLLVLTISCTQNSSQNPYKDIDDEKPTLTYDELASTNYKLNTPHKIESNSNQTYSKRQKDLCNKLYTSLAKPHVALYKFLPKDSKPSQTPRSQLALLPENTCSSTQGFNKLYEIVSNFYSKKPSKVGFNIPLTGAQKDLGNNINKGIVEFIEQNKTLNEVITLNNGSMSNEFEIYLSKLIFIHDADIIITGALNGEVDKAIKWANHLKIITFILNNTKQKKLGPFSYQIYPREEKVWAKVSDIMRYRNIRSSAILYPIQYQNSDFIKGLESNIRLATKLGVGSEHYDPQKFETIDTAIKSLFEVYNDENDEFKPEKDFDAIYLMGDFKSVRYLSKMMKYYGIKKPLLIGNQSWRSKAILTPYDSFLDGAYFIDVLPSYNKIREFEVKNYDKGIFASFETMNETDFKLIGYLATKVAFSSLLSTDKTKSLNAQIKNSKSQFTVTDNKNKVFDNENHFAWKAFSFQVLRNRVIELNY